MYDIVRQTILRVDDMEEVKTSEELYAKIQAVIDELDSVFFSGTGRESIPEVVFAINN